uniref:KIB1-4 beta-propeller domain-containing protein n=1 Tax=Oryza punctata TaxID=4537 RepID=A0A0E0L7G4_ORYPU
MSPSTSRRPSPFLVLCTDADGERPATTLYNVANGVHRPCDIDDELLRTKRSWVTSHGGSWVLTWDSATLATFLWNPHAAAGETNVVLPSFGRAPPDIEACCALSTGEPAGDGGGFSVAMVEVDSNVLWYCHAGATSSSSWAKHEYDIGDGRTICSFTPCSGKLYYLIMPGMSYGVLEFSPEPVFTTVPAKPIRLFATPDCMLVFSAFPVAVNGKLYVVFIFRGEDGNTDLDVDIYRVDLEKRKHVRIRSIGDRAIFVGGGRNHMEAAGWCRASRHGLLPNSIYWVSQFDHQLHVYDLGERTEEIRYLRKGIDRPPSPSTVDTAQQARMAGGACPNDGRATFVISPAAACGFHRKVARVAGSQVSTQLLPCEVTQLRLVRRSSSSMSQGRCTPLATLYSVVVGRSPSALKTTNGDGAADGRRLVDGDMYAATLYGVSDGEHRPCEADELRHNRCWATSNGWVLCCDPVTLTTFLWNPQEATGGDGGGGGGKIALPPFTQPPPPANSHYVLWYCHVGGGGGGSSSSSPSPAAGWMRHEYDVGGTDVRLIGGYRFVWWSISGLTACRGRFYYFHTVTVLAMNMAEKVAAGETMSKASVYTLEIDGELYMVYIFFHGDDDNHVVNVGVYRMDFRKRRAVRVRSVGDRAIIAGSNIGGWCPAGGETGLRPNCVYWTSPYNKCLQAQLAFVIAGRSVKHPDFAASYA